MDNKEVIRKIKDRIDIVSLVERYVPLKQSGHNHSGLCPFHNEKTPSFSVNSELGMFKCFGCGKSGDIFTFIEEIEKIDFREALEKLAKEANVELGSKKITETSLQINKWAQTYYSVELHKNENSDALNYIRKRGIDEKSEKAFGIGYATGNGQFLQRLNKYRKFNKTDLLNTGIFVEKNGAIVEKFKKRVMFPIYNLQNEIIAFSGRLLPGNEYGPKYLNSAEARYYKKRDILYGMNLGKSSIKKEDLCILLEGNTDVISMHNIGYKNSVAPLGTGLTKEQLELISNYTNNILFLFDTDNAGQEAVERGFKLALQLNLKCYSVNTDKYKDIDELIQNEPNKVSTILENRKDTFTYLVSRKIEKNNISSLKGLESVDKYIKELLNFVSDETEKEFYLSQVEKLIPELNYSAKKNSNNNTKIKLISKKRDSLEKSFIKSLLTTNPKVEHLNTIEKFLKSETSLEILASYKDSDGDLQETLSLLNSKTLDIARSLILETSMKEPIEPIIKRIELEEYSSKVKTLRTSLAIAEEKEDTLAIDTLFGEIKELTLKIKEIKNASF